MKPQGAPYTRNSLQRSTTQPRKKKIDPLFLNRLVQARGYKNYDLRSETMEASFVTVKSRRNSLNSS